MEIRNRMISGKYNCINFTHCLTFKNHGLQSTVEKRTGCNSYRMARIVAEFGAFGSRALSQSDLERFLWFMGKNRLKRML